jgi:gas vesicle protein
MKDSAKVIVALMGGAATGAAAALLLAPTSGAKLRRNLNRTSRRLKEDITDTLETGIERIREISAMGGEKIDKINESISHSAETGKRMFGKTFEGNLSSKAGRRFQKG